MNAKTRYNLKRAANGYGTRSVHEVLGHGHHGGGHGGGWHGGYGVGVPIFVDNYYAVVDDDDSEEDHFDGEAIEDVEESYMTSKLRRALERIQRMETAE